jgi:LacI family transcriptional regulator
LTTIRQSVVRMGREAVNVLLDVIENGPTPQRRVVFDTELVIRESCGANLATR